MSLTTRAGLAALVTAAWAVWLMSAANPYPFPHVFHHDVDSPVLALEISRDAADIDAVLHRSDVAIKSMDKVNRLDLIFIPLYAFSIWSFARVFAIRTRGLTTVILLAAFFDYLEDGQIYQALAGANPPIYIPSLVKWGFLGLVFLALSHILLKSDSPVYSLSTKRLLAIGYFISGVLVLMDVALGEWIGYSHIELAMLIFSQLTVVNIIGFLGHFLIIPGMKQTFVENFCDKKTADPSVTAVKGERV